MARVNLGRVVPQRGIDYLTPAEQTQFEIAITSDVESNLDTHVTEVTNDFNSNALEKTQDFNDNAAAKMAELEEVLDDYSKIEDTGSKIVLAINNTNFKMTASLKDKNNNVIDTSNEIDLPIESMVVNASYDSVNKKIILTLQNGTTIEVSVADLVSGLQPEITSSNKLASDLVDDTSSTNKFVTTAEKTTWNAKADKTYVDSLIGDINSILDDINGEVV